MSEGWTPERTTMARALYGEGHSASQIASAIGDGVTRNAILGKAHREGWSRDAQAALGWTEARKKQAFALYNQGRSGEAIALAIGGGISAGTAVDMAVRMGARRPRRIDPFGWPSAAKPKTTSPASSAAARVDGAAKQGSDRIAQKAAETQPARRASSPGILVDHSKSSRSAAAGSKGEAAPNRSRWSADPPPRPDNEPVTFMDRRHNQCGWPLGDPQDFDNFRYCGAHIEREAASYCAFHARIAYVPARDRRRPPKEDAAPRRQVSRFALLNSSSGMAG